MEDSPLVKQIDTSAVSQLMVNPNTDSVPAGALSSSSSISTASSSSCNSCCVTTTTTATGYLPKSTSNPMLLSLVSSSSSISSNPAPSSPSFNQNTNVMELFTIKKSPADETLSYENSSYANNNSSSNSSLISVVTSNGGINSAVETAAKKYRCAAQVSEATCCWKGKIGLVTNWAF